MISSSAYPFSFAGPGHSRSRRERPACIDIDQNVTCTSSAIDLLLDALQQWEAPALGLGIDLSVAASACDPGQFCMQQHARSIAFMHASWLVQSPCLSFSNCGTHTHTGIEEAAGKRARAHTQTRECTAQRYLLYLMDR